MKYNTQYYLDHKGQLNGSSQRWLVSTVFSCMGSATERRRYNVTPSLIGWTHARMIPAKVKDISRDPSWKLFPMISYYFDDWCQSRMCVRIGAYFRLQDWPRYMTYIKCFMISRMTRNLPYISHTVLIFDNKCVLAKALLGMYSAARKAAWFGSRVYGRW